ncbi:MAG: hypothetical protein DRR06_00810 [Gammaproteobacteria bacterium]|nr:MAG: hypothetical protein DRR06_00810 [Gammaproteobacteria bacterium]RLA51437.1 MAG: hypothetical protein DRR42_10400 [Gammaproteobacteria bacterium]
MSDMEFLGLYAEVALAFVAFAAIVATLRQAFHEHFTPLQYVMFRFFVESGMIYVANAFVSLALLKIVADKDMAWQLSIYYLLANLTIYMPFHIRRRRRLGVALPRVSLIVIAGYVILEVLMIATVSELWWQPSFTVVAVVLMWGLVGNGLIFLQFLETFVSVKEVTLETG